MVEIIWRQKLEVYFTNLSENNLSCELGDVDIHFGRFTFNLSFLPYYIG